MERYICPECGTEMKESPIDAEVVRIAQKWEGRINLFCPKCRFSIMKNHYNFLCDLGKYGAAKPPLGCAPYYVGISARICALCEAIKRYSTAGGKHDKIKLWAYEILQLNEMDRNLRYEEKRKVWKEDKHGKLQEMP